MKTITRRRFLKVSAGTGLSLAAAATPLGYRLLSASDMKNEGASLQPSVWLRIASDNMVTIIVNKSEMGQGVYTSLPMIVADELDADWKNVQIEAAPAADVYKDPIFGLQGTGGSSSIRHMYEPLRMAGAAAREMLLAAASQEWGVPVKECVVQLGRIRHLASNRMLMFGQVADKASRMTPPQRPTLKKESQYRYIGKALARLDVQDKVNGKTLFGIDCFVQDMLYAVIARPSMYGASLIAYDKEAAQQIPGVKQITPIYSGVVVCADTINAAWKGRDALKASWQDGRYPRLSTTSLENQFMSHLLNSKGVMARNDGDAAGAINAAKKKVDAIYVLPYLSHATMEPMNCTVHVRSDGCDIWVPTQFQTTTHMLAVKMTGLKPEQVKVHTTYLGGGFGRRSETDVVEEALTISMATGRPVKLIWSREEDMQNDFYRPANCSRIQGALSDDGLVTAWAHKIVCPSIFSRVFPQRVLNGIDPAAVEGLENMEYEILNLSVEYVRAETPVPVGFWRSVGSSHNAFTVESFVDELANAGGKDPLEFRLKLLKQHPRAQRVLQVAAEKAGWGKPLARGQARGIAYHLSFGSYVAQVAEVSVNKADGSVKVHSITCAVDCGPTINPDIVQHQIMGGITMGLSAALKEKTEFANGGVKSENFGDYELLRMSEAAEVNVHIVKSGDKLGGIGEPGLPPVAPAVANAIFTATGARLRRLPMIPATVLESMKQA
ncbi:MAG TPA: xanthine dehydrogenase family protein molybdopterin-binding subunit [Nitrospirota bacterium]|nr:xanthine dehydrogenase family protein molybdopterin-binding subunit [Nitrospirota bacterium]